jgi:hypothetical protein
MLIYAETEKKRQCDMPLRTRFVRLNIVCAMNMNYKDRQEICNNMCVITITCFYLYPRLVMIIFPHLWEPCALFNPLTPELNPSAQRCLTRFCTENFAA